MNARPVQTNVCRRRVYECASWQFRLRGSFQQNREELRRNYPYTYIAYNLYYVNLISIRGFPFSTVSRSLTNTRLMVPFTVARNSFSIFIASSTQSRSPMDTGEFS